MGKKAETVETPTRSEAINLDATAGRAILAAWQGVYHLFGGRVNEWVIDSENNGVVANGFSVDNAYDPNQIVNDIATRERRLDLITTYGWLNGQAPANFTDSAEMTAFMVQFFKGSVEEGSAKSPKYVKDAVAAYKAANSLTKKRGPKKRVNIIRLDNLSEVDEAALKDIDEGQLAALQATLERAIAAKRAG